MIFNLIFALWGSQSKNAEVLYHSLLIGKGVRQGCILSPCLFSLYAEYIMQNARLNEAQAGIKIAGININNLRYADDTTLMAESEEELKSLLMKVKKESEKAGVKLNIKKKNNKQHHGIWSHYFMANRWGNNRNSERLYFPGFKKSLWMVTAAMKLKCFLLGRKAMTNLYSLLKSRDITLPTNVCLVKAVVFPVVMYGCESWTINKAEC